MKCIISFSSTDEAFGLQRHGAVTKLCISLQTHYELNIKEEKNKHYLSLIGLHMASLELPKASLIALLFFPPFFQG